ncbi:MAG: hypothetical protein WKG01_38380 [Kofleriaceae bacterium]
MKTITIPPLPTPTPTPTADPMVAIAPGTPPTPTATPATSVVASASVAVAAGMGATGAPGIESASATALGAIAQPEPVAPTARASAAQPPMLTPLEQAVQALFAQIQPREPATAGEDEEEPGVLELPVEPGATSAAPGAVRVATDAPRSHPGAPAVAATAPEQAEPLANPSHVHLVMNDGDQRVVVTVAVRGNEVRVAMRGTDDTTVAALARNAGSLDHALRARGLDLTDFTAPDRERERADHPSRHQSQDSPPERQQPGAPGFRLEENT